MSATAHAKVTVMIDIKVGGGAWGKDCTVSQVHKQALDHMRNRLDRLSKDNPDISVHKEMQVHMITFPLEERPSA